jgi:methyl acetate hydrolase
MLMHGGSFNGAQILKPATVALMSRNHIGDINVNTRILKTMAPAISNDVDFGKLFPGQEVGPVVLHQHQTGARGA